MGATVRSQTISSPSDSRSGTHSRQDGKVPWEHSSCMENSTRKLNRDHHPKINDVSPKVRDSKAVWKNDAQTRHTKPICQKDKCHLEKIKGKGKYPKAVSALNFKQRPKDWHFLLLFSRRSHEN